MSKELKLLLYLFISLAAINCTHSHSEKVPTAIIKKVDSTQARIELIVLGNVQDGGSPHIGCQKNCCRALFGNPDPKSMVVALGIIDHGRQKTFLIEASPDMPRQIEYLQKQLRDSIKKLPDAIFVTHAHIGHYTGLMYLGREAMGADAQPVYLMPQMKNFIETNGPWNQLVELNNILIYPLKNNEAVPLSSQISITPFRVPHRDEYSETVGFKISTPNTSLLFIPDIDKWDRWRKSIIEEVSKVDYAFLDGTFFDSKEIPHRPMSEIPHPFITESMAIFNKLPTSEKAKIYFIHLNHSNPTLDPTSSESQTVEQAGMHIARFGDRFSL